jgi:hypothetical protein
MEAVGAAFSMALNRKEMSCPHVFPSTSSRNVLKRV